MYPAKNLTSFAADGYLSQTVVAAEGSGFSVQTSVDDVAAEKFLLHLHENFTRYDGWMTVFSISFEIFKKLRNISIIIL
jgi:hypothetical protein